MDEEIGILLKAKDMGATSTLRKVQAGIAGVQGQAAATGTALTRGIGGGLARVNQRLGGFRQNFSAAMGQARQGAVHAASAIRKVGLMAGGLAIAGGAMAVKWAADFESQMNVINTIAHETPEELNKIGDSIRAVARDSGQPLSDLTQGYYDLLSAGISTADAQGVLDNAVTLGVGGLASTVDTIDLLTTAYNVYGGGVQGAATMTDQFAVAIERGKVTAGQIASTYSDVASLAMEVGIGNDEISASYARLTAAGKQPGKVATQMGAAITSLMKPTADLEKLSKTTGRNYLRMAGNKGLAVALQQMRKDAEAANKPLIKMFGRKEGYLFALSTTGAGFTAYQQDLSAVMSQQGVAAKQAAERQQGFNYQMSRAKANIKDAGITIGTALLPPLADAAGKFATWLNTPEQQENLKSLAKDLGAGFKEVATWIGTIDFEKIGATLKTAANMGKQLIDAFAGAPEWLKTAVITGWGLNKLTGGAVTGIVGSLSKGLVGGVSGALSKGMFQRGSSPGSPLYVIAMGGGMGGAAGKGGRVGTAAAGASRFGGIASKAVTAVSIIGIAGSALALFQAWGDFRGRVEADTKAVNDQADKWIPTAAEDELLTAWGGLKDIPNQLDGIGAAIYGASDLFQGLGVDAIFGGVAGTNEAQIAKIEAQLGRIPTADEVAEATARIRARDAAPAYDPLSSITVSKPLPVSVTADATAKPKPSANAGAVEPSSMPVVKIGKGGATAIGQALATGLNTQTGELRTALQAIQGGANISNLREQMATSRGVLQQQVALLSAILGRSRNIYITIAPAPVVLTVDGHVVANALTDEILRRSPMYPGSGGLP